MTENTTDTAGAQPQHDTAGAQPQHGTLEYWQNRWEKSKGYITLPTTTTCSCSATTRQVQVQLDD